MNQKFTPLVSINPNSWQGKGKEVVIRYLSHVLCIHNYLLYLILLYSLYISYYIDLTVLDQQYKPTCSCMTIDGNIQ